VKTKQKEDDKEGWITPRRINTIKPRKIFKREQKEEIEKMRKSNTSKDAKERIEQKKDWSTPKRQIESKP